MVDVAPAADPRVGVLDLLLLSSRLGVLLLSAPVPDAALVLLTDLSMGLLLLSGLFETFRIGDFEVFSF